MTIDGNLISSRKQPKAAYIFSTILAMGAISIISFCIARRTKNFPAWKHVPVARWLILAVYIDSWLFTFSSTVLQTSFGLNSSNAVCGAAILLCLVCYLTSKILIYFFLVEKVYIIRSKHKCPRHKDKLYLFNTLGMLLPFCIVVSLTFIFRLGKLDKEGQCYIGLKLQGNIPLLVFDATINVYLTSLFLSPLIGLYSFEQSSPRLRQIAKRTFWGSAATLTSSVANLTTMIILKGYEPGWVCFACCNADVVFSALVLHWVTSSDYENQSTSGRNENCTQCRHQTPSSPQTKFSALRSVNRADFIGAGSKRGDVITECIGGKRDDDHSSSYQLEGITVRVDHRCEVEEASEGGSTTSPIDHGNASTDKIHCNHHAV